MPGRPDEDWYAAGEECLRQALAGLAVAGQHQAEVAARHVFQQLPVRLHTHGIRRIVPVGAGNLRGTRQRSGPPGAGAHTALKGSEPATRPWLRILAAAAGVDVACVVVLAPDVRLVHVEDNDLPEQLAHEV